MHCTGRERAALPMLLARFGRWPELLALSRADLDYSRDGLAMLPPGTEAYNDGLFHYVRLLALASAAAHEPDGALACMRMRTGGSSCSRLVPTTAQQLGLCACFSQALLALTLLLPLLVPPAAIHAMQLARAARCCRRWAPSLTAWQPLWPRRRPTR